LSASALHLPPTFRSAPATMAPTVAARRVLLLPAVVATAASPAELRAALAQLPSQPLVQMEPVARYDCDVEYDMWKTAWTPDWKAWCCQNRQRGCPSTTTETRTTSTSTPTTTTSTTTTTTTTTEDPESCNAFCTFDNVNATCSARIAWAVSQLKFSCHAAHKLVLKQCNSCALCSMKLASKIQECEAEQAEDQEQEGANEADVHKRDEGGDPDAVFLAKKFGLSQPVGSPPQRSGAPQLLSSPAPLLVAAAVAAVALAIGLRRHRRATAPAMLTEVPLAPSEPTE